MKNFIKTISLMIVTVLILSSVLPVSIYASSVITDGENNSAAAGARIGAEDITIQLANSDPLRKSVANVLDIPVKIDAYNSSYIKDASISFENSNFNVAVSEIATNKNVQSVKDDVIKLNSSEIDEEIELKIPVSFKKADYVAEDYFNRAVTIKLAGTYVNKNGEEKEFSKTTQANISWFVQQRNVVANTEIVRSFAFSENGANNVMVTLKLTSGIEDGAAVEKQKTIEVNVPKITSIYPQVFVSTDKYGSEENQSSGKITLTKNIEKNDGNEYKWENENDVIYITYIYRGITNSFYSDAKEVRFRSSTTTIDDAEHGLTKESNGVMIPLDRNNEIDDVIIASATSTSSINRGYIISNANIETNFDVKYSLNIGYPQMTNNITVKENQSEYSSAYRTKTVSVNANELTRILGDNGKITISLKDSSDTYEITKNNTTITIPSGKEINTMVTSKPTGIGNLSINLVKTLNSSASESLAGKTKIVGTATITNTDLANNQSTATCQWETKIEEPTQKVHFESKFKTLSTIKKNERMILSVVLESDSVDDYLYKNPSLRITYPESIKEISNVTVNILYDDNNELTSGTPSINNANHTIILQLTGTQTHYTSSAVSKGILIQIAADYTLDRLTPTKDSKIQLELHNVNTNQTTTLEKEFKTIAPTEFIVQNKMVVTSPTNSNDESNKNYFKESRETITEDVEDIVMPLYSNEKYIDVYGTVVNNQGDKANNVTIIGNFPSKDTNSYSGAQFNATFDTTVVGEIEVENKKVTTEEETYTVYYSKNANEPINSTNWTEEFMGDAKSYKIAFNGKFENTERKEFHYVVKTPADLTYNEHAKESFALVYGTNAVAGEQHSYVEAKPIGVATKPEADFSVDVSVKDIVKGQEVRNGENVDEGAYLNVKISITNTSNRKISDVRAEIELKLNLFEVEISNELVSHKWSPDNIVEDIGVINASETKTINKTLYVNFVRDDVGTEDVYSIMNIQVYEGDELEFKPQEFKNKIATRKVSYITVASAQNKDVGINDSFQQYFYIRNLTKEKLNNVEIKGKIPEGLDYDSEKNEKTNITGLTYTYDSSSREYTIKIDEIDTYSLTTRIPLNFKTSDYGTYELKARAIVENEEYNFNTINITVAGKARNFEVSHTISTPTNMVKDTDIFNFNITIKNHWENEKLVVFKDRLDTNFVVYEYVILQNNKMITQNDNSNLIEYNFIMEAEDVAEIRIKCGLKTQSKGDTINLTHRPEATCEGVNIVINPITINVTGTGEFINTNVPVIDGKYNISGTAWLDANNNGRREDTEQRIANITMKLFDNETKKIVIDDAGNEKITTTNNNGDYIFTDLPVGSYVVVAYYDSDKYGCGDYHNRDVSEDLNNDFIETEFEGKTVGATNNIIIQNGNITAIDISLIPRNTFDMALEKNVTNVAITTSNGKEASYKYNSNLAKVEVSNEKGVKYYFTIEYTLTVKNIGYIDGYAKSVIDYIPKGMTFVQEDNPGWYIKSDGNAYNDTLANTLIKAQKQVDVKIKLRKEMTAEQTGMIKNSAELGDVYNTEGIEDINSKGANKDSSENDYSEALVVVALSTGGEIIKVAGIVFGVLALGVIILSITKYKGKRKII